MVRLYVRKPDEDKIALERELTPGVYTVGRTVQNHIVLNDPTVSSRHCRIRVAENGVFVTDLGSMNLTYVNGQPLIPQKEAQTSLQTPIQIGVFLLSLDGEAQVSDKAGDRPISTQTAARDDEDTDRFKVDVQEKLFKRLDLVRLEAQEVDREELQEKARKAVTDIVREMGDRIPHGKTLAQMTKEVLDEALGLGPLEGLLSDPTITEIMVVKRGQIYIERGGKLVLSGERFSSDDHLRHAIERIVSSKGRRIDELHPYVDTRLDDGSRVNAVIPPIAIDGPVLTIRKFPEKRFGIEDLVRFGSCTEQMVEFLRVCVRHRKSTLISGGTGSGKTTLLNALASFIPADERLITVEDSAELNLPQEHVVRLEGRPPNIEGKGQVAIRDLVRNCLRMRPDRIIVGECRGGEAIDMLQAMNTGHDGSMTTLHANTPRDAISRLTTMCLMSDLELPSRSIQEQIASAISLIVQTSRMADGARRIVRISEVVGVSEEGVRLDTVFVFRETGYDGSGRILGRFVCEKPDPLVFQQLREQRISAPDLSVPGPTPSGLV